MTEHPLIPQEKREAVTRALHEAFGVAEFEDIRELTGGNTTSRVCRIVVQGSPYVLKMILRTDDATRHYACMRSAADAGLAPRVWYTNVEDRTSITDCVNAVPFPITDALVRIPAALRALHLLPPFGTVPDPYNSSCMFLLNKGPARDGYLQKFQTANLLPEEEIQEYLARLDQLTTGYPRHVPDMVSSHNDLFKPDNMLFDGDRLLLIDWEAAFLNDRYADLAVVANMIVTNDAEEQAYLETYFGQPPDPYQRARFHLMRQLAHMFYTMAFLMIGSKGRVVDFSETVPGYADFQRRFWVGDVILNDDATKITYGRIHWKRFLENLRQPRFQESLRIVSGQHTSSA